MAKMEINGTEIYYEDTGQGDETIIFSHGYLFSSEMFASQKDHFNDRYRVIVYDHRGQGQSEISDDGYDIDSITTDALTLINSLVDGPVHFFGLSMGGFVGMRLAVEHPEKIQSLGLLNSSAEEESGFKLFRFKVLRIFGRIFGLGLVIGPVMKALFGKTFLQDQDRKDTRDKWKEFLKQRDKVGVYRAFEAAVLRDSYLEKLSRINQPTLIIAGDEDKGLSLEESEIMHKKIPSSQLRILEGVGHSSTIEAPDQVNQAIDDFLSDVNK